MLGSVSGNLSKTNLKKKHNGVQRNIIYLLTTVTSADTGRFTRLTTKYIKAHKLADRSWMV